MWNMLNSAEQREEANLNFKEAVKASAQGKMWASV